VRGLKPAQLRQRVTKTLGRTPRGVRGLKLADDSARVRVLLSHPARGAWIETAVRYHPGVKLGSHPARGAWIETGFAPVNPAAAAGRTPRGVRGLKREYNPQPTTELACRTPRGVRGLKLQPSASSCAEAVSHPARGAWIETSVGRHRRRLLDESHPARGAWIET